MVAVVEENFSLSLHPERDQGRDSRRSGEISS